MLLFHKKPQNLLLNHSGLTDDMPPSGHLAFVVEIMLERRRMLCQTLRYMVNCSPYLRFHLNNIVHIDVGFVERTILAVDDEDLDNCSSGVQCLDRFELS